MNFFEHQDRARKQSRRLTILFILAVLAIVVAIDGVVAAAVEVVVHVLQTDQLAFGEGFGDALAILLYDDPVIARDYAGPGRSGISW